MHLFFGEFGSDLVEIDMRPDGKSAARVRSFGSIPRAQCIAGMVGPYKRIRAVRALMNHLAGDCAENLALGNNNPNWLEWRFYEKIENVGFWFYWDRDDGSDFADAAKVAMALYGKSERGKNFLRRVGRWTEECISEPQMWTVVVSLAEKLVTTDYMDADEAWSIMLPAWHGDEVLPYRSCGKKWQRRLEVPRNRRN